MRRPLGAQRRKRYIDHKLGPLARRRSARRVAWRGRSRNRLHRCKTTAFRVALAALESIGDPVEQFSRRRSGGGVEAFEVATATLGRIDQRPPQIGVIRRVSSDQPARARIVKSNQRDRVVVAVAPRRLSVAQAINDCRRRPIEAPRRRSTDANSGNCRPNVRTDANRLDGWSKAGRQVAATQCRKPASAPDQARAANSVGRDSRANASSTALIMPLSSGP